MIEDHKDFEVISNSDTDMESQNSSDSEEESSSSEISIRESKVIGKDDNYSQDDHTFMFELYSENRHLLEQITEKDKQIAKLEERINYLTNSNVFWLCCYIGSSAIGLFSLIHH